MAEAPSTPPASGIAAAASATAATSATAASSPLTIAQRVKKRARARQSAIKSSLRRAIGQTSAKSSKTTPTPATQTDDSPSASPRNLDSPTPRERFSLTPLVRVRALLSAPLANRFLPRNSSNNNTVSAPEPIEFDAPQPTSATQPAQTAPLLEPIAEVQPADLSPPDTAQQHTSPAPPQPDTTEQHSSPAPQPDTTQQYSSPAPPRPDTTEQYSSPASPQPDTAQQHSSPALSAGRPATSPASATSSSPHHSVPIEPDTGNGITSIGEVTTHITSAVGQPPASPVSPAPLTPRQRDIAIPRTRTQRGSHTSIPVTPIGVPYNITIPATPIPEESTAVPITGTRSTTCSTTPIEAQDTGQQPGGDDRLNVEDPSALFWYLQDKHPNRVRPTIYDSREEGAATGKGQIYFYSNNRCHLEYVPATNSGNILPAAAEGLTPSRKRRAEDTEADLREQLELEEEALQRRRERLLTKNYSGTSYMTVRYSCEARVPEVIPVDELEEQDQVPPPQAYRGIWALLSLDRLRAAMRPEAVKKLFKDGYTYLTEKLLGRVADQKYDVVETRRVDDRGRLTVKRLKTLQPELSGSAPQLPVHHEYQYRWRDNPYDYIGEYNLQAVVRLLRAWTNDIKKNYVRRSPKCGLVSNIVDYEEPTNVQLSVIIHNLMIKRHVFNTEQNWTETTLDVLHDLEAAAAWIITFYSFFNFNKVRSQGFIDDEGVDGGCQLCAVDTILAFIVNQNDRYQVLQGLDFPERAVMMILTDLEVVHKQQLPLSYVDVQQRQFPPGYYYGDELVEEVTADQLGEKERGNGLPDYEAEPKSKSKKSQRICPRGTSSPSGSHPTTTTTTSSTTATTTASDSASARAARTITQWNSWNIRSPRESPRKDSYLIDAADRQILGYTPDRQRPTKRKVTDIFTSPRDYKRRRLFTTNADAPSYSPKPNFDDNKPGEMFRPLAKTRPRVKPSSVIFPESDPDEPGLKLSRVKADELRHAVEQKIAAQEAARRKQEAEEARRREKELRQKEEEERLASTGLRRPMRQFVAPLAEEWQAKVKETLEADPSRELAKSPEGTSLRSKDFKTVAPRVEWLNDEIVNGALIHLANYVNQKAGVTNPKTQTPKCHAFTSFFWGQLSTKGAAGTERWMKRVGVTRENFLDIDTILIPICQNNHWTLVVVRPTKRDIAHMDSLGPGGAGRRHVTDVVLQWVKDFLKDKSSEDWRVRDYKSPQQTNGWDCGVHTVTNAMCLALGLDPSFYTSQEMPLQRFRIAGMLLNGGFSGDFDLDGF